MGLGERMLAPLAEVDEHARDHAILIGYGVAGRLVGEALRREYVALPWTPPDEGGALGSLAGKALALTPSGFRSALTTHRPAWLRSRRAVERRIERAPRNVPARG